MLGAECMADMLEAYGVTHVFHVPAVLRKTLKVRAPAAGAGAALWLQELIISASTFGSGCTT